jgi:predicted DCC family thiol-disulfide oxidoreductase YuxK
MTDRIKQSQHNPTQFLPWAAVGFAIGLALHGLDHLRRGISWFTAVAEISTGIIFGFAGIDALSGHRSGILFFDGACGMCTRSVELVSRLNRTGELQTEPLQSPGAAERLGISPSQLLDSTRWLDSSGVVYCGAEAMNAAMSSAIGSRLPLLLYRIPGIRFIQDAIYRWWSHTVAGSPERRRTVSLTLPPADVCLRREVITASVITASKGCGATLAVCQRPASWPTVSPPRSRAFGHRSRPGPR